MEDNYYQVNDYRIEIVDIIQELATAEKLGKKEIHNRVEEAFHSGLNSTTEIEMAKVGVHTMEEIYARIRDTEAIISRETSNKL